MTNNLYKTIYRAEPFYLVTDSEEKIYFRVLTNPKENNREFDTLEFVVSKDEGGKKRIALNGEFTKEMNEIITNDREKKRLKFMYNELGLPEIESGVEMYDPKHPFTNGQLFRLYTRLSKDISNMKPEVIMSLSDKLSKKTGMTSQSIQKLIESVLKLSPDTLDTLLCGDQRKIMPMMMEFGETYSTDWTKLRAMAPKQWTDHANNKGPSQSSGKSELPFIM